VNGTVYVQNVVQVNGTTSNVGGVTISSDPSHPVYIYPATGAIFTTLYDGFTSAGFANPIPVTSSTSNPFLVYEVTYVGSILNPPIVNVNNWPSSFAVSNFPTTISVSNFPTTINISNTITCDVQSLPDLPPIYYTNYLEGPQQGFYVPFTFSDAKKLRKS